MQDAWTENTSKGSWGTQSRGQSLNLNNEAAYHSLPDILKSRAENVDIEDIERGSLLGRGWACAATTSGLPNLTRNSPCAVVSVCSYSLGGDSPWED